MLTVAGISLLSATGCGTSTTDRSGATRLSAAGSTPNASPARSSGPSPGPLPPGTAPAVNVPSPTLNSPAGSASARPAAKDSPPLYSLPSTDKLVALTLDDGPDPHHTPIVLDILRQHGIRATFFIIGENAAEHPELLRAISDEGHHLANHTWSHPDLRHLPDSQVYEELTRTSDVLQKATGKPLTWFRAPGGDWSPATLRTCAELGMRPMGWSVDPRDWARPGTSKITNRVLEAIRPGSIVLNHDGGGDRSQTIAALRTYLPVLIEDGYHFTAPR